jgi:hypothetical protein
VVPVGLPAQVLGIACAVAGFVLAIVALAHGTSLDWAPWSGNPFGR